MMRIRQAWLLATVLAFAAAFAQAETWRRFDAGDDLSPSAGILPTTDGRRGLSGFSFAVDFSAPEGFSGVVVRKPGVFALEVSGPAENRLYTFRMDGTNVYVPTLKENVLKANGESGGSATNRVAGVLMYCHEPEQANVGHRMFLYLNGELIGSSPCTSFRPEARVRLPVVLEPRANVAGVSLGDHACAPDALFPAAGGLREEIGDWQDASTRAWRAAQKDVRFVSTPDLVVAVKEREVRGSPILGVWSLRSGHRICPADGLSWSVEYADAAGDAQTLRSGSRQVVSTVAFGEGAFAVVSRGKGLVVRHEVRLEAGRLERRLSVEDQAGSRIRSAAFPRVTLCRLPGRDTLVEPQFSGVLSEDPTRSHLLGGWMFPGGMVTMQFAGYYNEAGEGVYLGAEDPLAVTKSYAAEGVGGRLTVEFSQNAPRDASAKGAGRFVPSGVGALELYRGKWHEAGRVYRRFLAASAPWYAKDIPRSDSPAWFLRNPLWIMGLNLRPERLPAYRSLAEYFEFPPSFVCAAIRPPDGVGFYGPNYAILEPARDCYQKLQKEGLHFAGYTNPRLWYAGKDAEKSNDYSRKGQPWAIKDEQGVLRIERFGDNYVVPCPGVEPWRDHLCRRTRMLAQNRLDCVYHDQLPCAVPCLCYDATHGHPAGDPSVWLSGGWWKFGAYLTGDLRKEFPGLVHTGEDASEPLADKLDGFMVWRFGRTGHVPLFQSLYSPRVQFVGRGCDVHGTPGSYESFFPKYAEQLCYGEQIGWVSHQTVAYPSPRRGFLKKLAHCRADLCDFLNASEMEPPVGFARPPETMTTRWGVCGPNVVTTEKVLSSRWLHRDGRRLVMFLNTANEPQTVEPVGIAGGKVFTVCREKSSVPEVVSAAPRQVRLEPYGFEFWFVGESVAPEAERFARRLSRSVGFLRKDRGAMLSRAPAFAKTAAADAKDGKPVLPRNVAWGLLAYLPDDPHLDFSSRLPEARDGWLPVMDGGLVCYGTVDFGVGAKAMELNLATDEENVTVEFLDVTGDAPERRIAVFRPKAGDWHGYGLHVSPLLGETVGARTVVCRVTGGVCNIRNWRLLKTGACEQPQPLAADAPGRPAFAAEKKCDGVAGVAASDAAWILFARQTAAGVSLREAGYVYYGTVDFGKAAKRLEVTFARADADAVLDVVDVSEFAPSKPLARFKAAAGTMTTDLSFAVEGGRHIVLMARGGGCTVAGWRVLR